jgi:hypothetical protein
LLRCDVDQERCQLISRHVRQAYEQFAIVFARVSLILANSGFWVGSLRGD